jgi:hypothetical protein
MRTRLPGAFQIECWRQADQIFEYGRGWRNTQGASSMCVDAFISQKEVFRPNKCVNSEVKRGLV